MKWFIATVIALFLFSGAMPWLRRLGIGRLPGDWRFRIGQREYLLPFTSTLLLTLLVFLIGKLL